MPSHPSQTLFLRKDFPSRNPKVAYQTVVGCSLMSERETLGLYAVALAKHRVLG